MGFAGEQYGSFAQRVYAVKRPRHGNGTAKNDFSHFFNDKYTIFTQPFTIQFIKKLDCMSHIHRFEAFTHTNRMHHTHSQNVCNAFIVVATARKRRVPPALPRAGHRNASFQATNVQERPCVAPRGRRAFALALPCASRSFDPLKTTGGGLRLQSTNEEPIRAANPTSIPSAHDQPIRRQSIPNRLVLYGS